MSIRVCANKNLGIFTHQHGWNHPRWKLKENFNWRFRYLRMLSSNKTASTRARHVFSIFFLSSIYICFLGIKLTSTLGRTWPPKYTNYTHSMLGITHPKWLVAFYFRWNMFQPILKSDNLIGLSNPLHPMLGEVAVFLWSLSFVHFGPRNSRHFNPDMFIFVSWWPPQLPTKKLRFYCQSFIEVVSKSLHDVNTPMFQMLRQ